MKKYIFGLTLILCLLSLQNFAQLVTYSEQDRDDPKDMNFEIIGKFNGNVHIYKNYRDVHYISQYDISMKNISKEKLEFMPDRIINVDFLQLSDSYYLFYQYQKRSVVYCMAVKFDANGKTVGNPLELDTTNISFSASNKLYSVVYSEDKQKIMVVKINRPNDKNSIITANLFDRQLNLIKKSVIPFAMQERNATLSEFQVDNDGDLVFVKTFGSGANDVVNKVVLITKNWNEETIRTTELNLTTIYLDDIRIKIDNYNKHYIIASFFTKQRRGNIDGLYCFMLDKLSRTELLNTRVGFSEEMRADLKSDGSTKTALNDFFLRNIIAKRDGGFILAAESSYTSSRGNDGFNRWDGFGYGLPYNNGFNSFTPYGVGGLYYNPTFRNNFNNITRYYSENIMVISLDMKGKLEWSNIIRKSQYDDNTDSFIGYGTVNTGNEIHFLFNVQEKRQLLFSDQIITPSGQIVRTPTFKNLDKGYDFMPRNAKQTGARQVIVPCMYRNYVCFAKVDF